MPILAALTDRFDRPTMLWLALLPVLVWLLSRRSLSGLPPARRWAAVIVRTIVVLLLVLSLAGLNQVRRNKDLAVIYLLDQSRSISPDQQEQGRKFVRASARSAAANDRVGAITFDGEAYIEQVPSRPGPDGGIFPDVALASPANRPDRSNLAAAVRMAMACFPEGVAKRLVLLSDGNQNVGDVLTEVEAAAANGVSVDIVPVRHEAGAEVTFERLAAPAYAREQELAPIRLTLRSQRTTTGRLQVYHDGQLVDLDPASASTGQRVELSPGINSFTLRIPLNHSGAHRFEARFEPDDPTADGTAANNVATGFTNVEGPPTVLLVSSRLEDDRALVAALRKEQIRVESRRAFEAQLDPLTLQQFAAVILANVPADQLTEPQHQALATYVRDLGGGLIMLGGDDGFGAGGWQSSVVESVMPVRFDVDEVRQIPRGALAIIVHACEMPQGNQWMIETSIAAMKTLSRLDYFGIVAFTGFGSGWEVPLRLCDDKRAIEAQIRKTRHGDAPSFDDMMDLAARGLIGRKDAAQRHMIIISDGDPSAPSTATMNRIIGARITVSTVKVFPHGGFDIETMNRIARMTGGTSYSLSQPGDEKRLPQIFIKEAKIVRRPLLREGEFQPQVKYALSDLLAGVDEAPPRLRGYVVTTPRSPAEIELPLVSDKGDPILANWQCGLGRSVAFTSGWWDYWGQAWTNWPAYSKIWAQIVRWSMAQGSAKDFEVATFTEGQKGRVVLEALRQDAGYLNFLQVQGVVVGPDGASRPVRVEQTGPGRYEGVFDMADTGTYLVNLRAGGGEETAVVRTGVSVAYSPEFKQLVTNESLLRGVADATNGRWIEAEPAQADIFAHNLPETIARQPIWGRLLRFAILLFLLDVAVRRISFDPARVARRLRGYIAELAGRFAPGKQAEVVLADLKSVRDKVRAEQTAAGDAPPTPVRLPRVEAGRKFEAPADAAKPTADLTSALGGAQAAVEKPAADPAKKKDKPPESTTARLLKSKKRRSDQGPPDGSTPGQG